MKKLNTNIIASLLFIFGCNADSDSTPTIQSQDKIEKDSSQKKVRVGQSSAKSTKAISEMTPLDENQDKSIKIVPNQDPFADKKVKSDDDN